MKIWLGAIAIVGALVAALWLWWYPSYSRVKVERAFAWSVAFSDQRIKAHVGRVKDAYLEKEPSASGRRSRDAHHRMEIGGMVNGSVAFLVLGEEGAGRALISYRWNHASGEHELTQIDFSPHLNKKPNKAPEPTPGSVTPRATSSTSK